MRQKFLKLFMLAATVLCANAALAQIDYMNDPKYMNYGSNPIAREANHKNYVFFTEAMKMNAFDDAEKRLEELLVEAPAATENLYINGRRLYLAKVGAATTPEQKMAYVEKLVRLQEIRNEHFANVAARGTKDIYKTRLLDFLQFNPEDVDRVVKYGSAAIAAAGKESDPEMIVLYFHALSNAYLQDKLSPDVYLTEYENVSNALTDNSDPIAEEKMKDCEILFVQSGAADCTNLEKIYKPKHQADPTDVNLIKKVMAYLVVGNCDGSFRMELSEKLFAADPTASAAFGLGLAFERAGDPEKALYYIEEAIKLETNNVEKAKYQVRVAASLLVAGKTAESVKYSRAAISSDDQNGLAYMLLSQAYGALSSKTGCTGIPQKAIYWVIVDILQKAKTLLANDATQVENINKLISSYSMHFPTVEELFFDPNISEGNSYTVNCGAISGVTRVRAAK